MARAPKAKPEEQNMNVESVALTDLVLDPKNARKGNVAAIVESLREFGQHRAVIVQRATNRVIAGNHLVQAAQTLGWTHIDCYFVDDDDKKAIRRAIADNAVGDKAQWDDKVLADLIEEVGSDIAGVDDELLSKLLKDTGAKEDATGGPVYPILPQPSEKYSYILFFADNELDSLLIDTYWGSKWSCYKSPSRTPRSSRILPISALRDVLDKLRAGEPTDE